MRTRRVVLDSVGIGCIAILGLVLWLTQMRYRIEKEQYYKIKHGMQRAEVVQLLGWQPGDYSSGLVRLWFTELRRRSVPGTPQDWITDQIKVTVWFDDDGKVTEANLLYNSSPTNLMRFWRWLRTFGGLRLPG